MRSETGVKTAAYVQIAGALMPASSSLVESLGVDYGAQVGASNELEEALRPAPDRITGAYLHK